MTKTNSNISTPTPFSICMDCHGPCTAGADFRSHGICDHCLAARYPAWPASRRHAESMRRGADAFVRGPAAQRARLEEGQ